MLINNAGAIKLVGVESSEPKRFDLMFQINTRAVMVCSQAALPFLKQCSQWPHPQPVAAAEYGQQMDGLPTRPLHTVTKYGMSMLTIRHE